MRNLKKLLALVLALVMSLSLVTIASAKSASDFADGKDITYTEAVDVMTAIGVFEGVGNNTFQPGTVVTREQAAKIVTYMLMPKADADRLTTTVAPYADVAADRWSAGAIAYCTNEGILAGVGGGKFDPAGQLTGLQFAKIMLVALGYDPAVEKLTGANWAINTAKWAITAGLDDELKDIALSSPMTREQAAQMAFNTLKANVVDYANRTEVNVGGTVVVMGGTLMESLDQGSYTDIFGENPQTLQFAEKYQKDLDRDTDPDSFGRPANSWSFDGNDVGTYGKDPAVVFTQATSDKDVIKAMNGYTFVDDQGNADASDDVSYKINDTDLYAANSNADQDLTDAGDTITKTSAYSRSTATPAASQPKTAQTSDILSSADYLASLTGNGKLVEIYANSKKVITDIVVIEYAVTSVTSISTNADGDVTYNLKGVTGGLKNYADPDTDDTIVVNSEIAKDDIVTYCSDGAKTYVYPTTKVVGQQSAYNEDKENITVSGTVYPVGAVWNHLLSTAGANKVDGTQFTNVKEDYNYYVDQYGAVVHTDAVSKDTNYCVVDAIAKVNGLESTAQARLIFADGSTQVVTVDTTITHTDGNTANGTVTNPDGENAANTAFAGIIYTYEIDEDGVYELTAVFQDGSSNTLSPAKYTVTGTSESERKAAVTKGVPGLIESAAGGGTKVPTDSATVFVVKTNDSEGNSVYTAYTGFQEVPTIESVASTGGPSVDYALKGNGEPAEFVYIDATGTNARVAGESSAGDYVYIVNDKPTVEGSGSDTTYYYSAIINGVAGTLISKTDKDNEGSPQALAKGLYKVVKVNKDGAATSLKKQSTGTGGTSDDDFIAVTSGISNSTCSDAGNNVIKINNVNYAYNGSETVYVIDKNGNVSTGDVSNLTLATNSADYSALYIKVVKTGGDAAEQATISVLYVVMA